MQRVAISGDAVDDMVADALACQACTLASRGETIPAAGGVRDCRCGEAQRGGETRRGGEAMRGGEAIRGGEARRTLGSRHLGLCEALGDARFTVPHCGWFCCI
mmetsp:Transcript_63270/g.135990  ORF Transcript_63270/g.135990 Transcript_63270/m.135990 type:complete len:103 (+) Transcript_63270:152-460(+)